MGLKPYWGFTPPPMLNTHSFSSRLSVRRALPVLISSLIVGLALNWAAGKLVLMNANIGAIHILMRGLAPTGSACAELVARHAESIAFDDSSLEQMTATFDEHRYSKVPKWCADAAAEAIRNTSHPKIIFHIQ